MHAFKELDTPITALCGYGKDMLLVGCGRSLLLLRLAADQTVLRVLTKFATNDCITCVASHGANFAVGHYEDSVCLYTYRDDQLIQLLVA